MYVQVRHRDPGHQEVDWSASLEQPVAQHGHRVGKRREGQVAVQRAVDRGHVAAGWRQVYLAAGGRAGGPPSAAQSPQVQLALPPLAPGDDEETRRDIAGQGLELVIQPVARRPRPDREPGRGQAASADADVSELRSERVVLNPDDGSARYVPKP